jgi:hypothetical protein
MAMDGILLDFGNLDSTTKWYLVIAITLTILYAVMRPLRKKKDPLAYGGQRVGLASQRAVEHDMTNLLVQLSDMARQVTAQLDTRTAKLELLIKDADERLAALKEANAHAEHYNANTSTNTADRGANGNGRPHDADAAPSPFAPTPIVESPHGDVYSLADQKLSPQQIAQRLSRPQGEIELILALRERPPEAVQLALADAIKPKKRKNAR